MNNHRDIDAIINSVREKYPNVCVDQLKVMHPADDDGIWYFRNLEFPEDEIQIESPYGACPFLIETKRDSSRRYGGTITEVVSIICHHFQTSSRNES